MEEYIKLTKITELVKDYIKEIKTTSSDNGIDYDEGKYDAARELLVKLIRANDKNSLS